MAEFHHAVSFLAISPRLSVLPIFTDFFLTFNIYLLDKSLENFHIYFFNYAQSVERCQSFQAKLLTKKHNLKL